MSPEPSLSVVIPAWNEATGIRHTLRHLLCTGAPREIIVVDGQSEDGTLEVVNTTPGTPQTRIVGLCSPRRGRGAQMNFGAAHATGDVLLFLHADTRPSPGWEEALFATLREPGTVAGFFGFAVDEASFQYLFFEWGTNTRARLLGLPYGDQGLFLERKLFMELGGFFEEPLMEDVEFLWRVKKRGKVRKAPALAITSARRFKKYGLWRGVARNFFLSAGFHLGVPASFLARFYRFGNR